MAQDAHITATSMRTSLVSALLAVVGTQSAACACSVWDMTEVVRGHAVYGGLSWDGVLFWLTPVLLIVLGCSCIRQWLEPSRPQATYLLILAAVAASTTFFSLPPAILRVGLSLCCCHEALCPDSASNVPPFAADACELAMETCTSGVYRQILHLVSVWLAIVCVMHTVTSQYRVYAGLATSRGTRLATCTSQHSSDFAPLGSTQPFKKDIL
ncbi:hypothetical protein H257_10546 [Aphanomyces astaci]|uniref:Uncharacterized protein n=1 Tax=Aphanomyces astaci TaxID=112090 RepID=W4G7I6_APHAT|nr:hypothetical protein H257_10546 [Aphanomyces astaci]ETV74923.1 hypothetical protein H257_10546 [Aphanomyces astaci]|eukprot:XP_009835427.1 hypothetical protein H257_10546 [Aphanomyces astaci]